MSAQLVREDECCLLLTMRKMSYSASCIEVVNVGAFTSPSSCQHTNRVQTVISSCVQLHFTHILDTLLTLAHALMYLLNYSHSSSIYSHPLPPSVGRVRTVKRDLCVPLQAFVFFLNIEQSIGSPNLIANLPM